MSFFPEFTNVCWYLISTKKYLKYKLNSFLEVSCSQNHKVVPSDYEVQKPPALGQNP